MSWVRWAIVQPDMWLHDGQYQRRVFRDVSGWLEVSTPVRRQMNDSVDRRPAAPMLLNVFFLHVSVTRPECVHPVQIVDDCVTGNQAD
ncbi:hypothetical protein GCT13_06885 [Paraburkholderia sp. CNPSo 3157]|uniref:Uncharacterized protein n=1 Tax=Paraburkholderia franconis TaxID=2654983 RepID=A0A7X1N7X9_9BURK|nr:hypothetical protein [Paraburkholderia franconis]MPW16666.1 hypothetical protein [Paraburkholderia franconis]